MADTELPVGVKALEWEYVERKTMTYTAYQDDEPLYYIDQSFGSDSFYFRTIRWPETTIYDGDDLPAAQAAAQADHERRTLSRLTPTVSDMRDAEGQAVDPHTFAMEYEFRSDDGDYTPTDSDRAMIEDAICGYMAAIEASALTRVSDTEGHKRGVEAALAAYYEGNFPHSRFTVDQMTAAIAAYLEASGAVLCDATPRGYGVERMGEIVGFIPGPDAGAEYRMPEDNLPRTPLYARSPSTSQTSEA